MIQPPRLDRVVQSDLLEDKESRGQIGSLTDPFSLLERWTYRLIIRCRGSTPASPTVKTPQVRPGVVTPMFRRQAVALDREGVAGRQPRPALQVRPIDGY